MYLDHRVIAKISSLLSKISMNVMLLDNNGQVILPEDNNREFTLPEALRQNPTSPLIYGGFTLIGTEGAHPLFLCLPGDSPDVSNCAILCAEMINMLRAQYGGMENSLWKGIVIGLTRTLVGRRDRAWIHRRRSGPAPRRSRGR
jgi:hypothetical protein